MRQKWDDSEVKYYRTKGFLTVEGFLYRDELRVWRETIDLAMADRGTRVVPDSTYIDALHQRARQGDENAKYYADVFTQRMNLWKTSSALKKLLFDSPIGRLAAELEGLEAARLWQDQALVKEAYANPTAFHLDGPFLSFDPPRCITIWIALDDATIENGCLYYVPESHREQRSDNVSIGTELGAIFKSYPKFAGVAPVPCPVPAGGALFHSGYTIHGAGPNMTPGRRRAMTFVFIPDGATFNGKPTILPPDYARTLNVGDALVSDEHIPRIYSREEVGT